MMLTSIMAHHSLTECSSPSWVTVTSGHTIVEEAATLPSGHQPLFVIIFILVTTRLRFQGKNYSIQGKVW